MDSDKVTVNIYLAQNSNIINITVKEEVYNDLVKSFHAVKVKNDIYTYNTSIHFEYEDGPSIGMMYLDMKDVSAIDSWRDEIE